MVLVTGEIVYDVGEKLQRYAKASQQAQGCLPVVASKLIDFH